MPDDARFTDRVEAALGLLAPPGKEPAEVEAPEAGAEASADTLTLPDGTAVGLDEVAAALRERAVTRRERELLADDRGRLAELVEALEHGCEDLMGLRRRSQKEWQALSEADPAHYLSDIAALDHGMRRHALVRAALETESRRSRDSHKQREYARLCEKLPDLKDTAKHSALLQEIAAFLKGEGFDEHQIDDLADHRTILVIRKAMQWDRQQAEAARARAKQAPPTPTVRPAPAAEGGGRGKAPRLIELARRTGRTDDRIAALEALLK